MAQKVKNPPAIQETQVQSLGQEDPLRKGIKKEEITCENRLLLLLLLLLLSRFSRVRLCATP